MANVIAQPRQGMIQDMNFSNLNGEVYTYALNAGVESNSEEGNLLNIQNEGSNILATVFPEGFVVIGKRRINEQNRTIFALLNEETGESEIGEVIHCTYDDNKDDLKLNSYCDTCEFEEQKERTPLEKIEQSPYCEYNTIISAECLNFNINNPVKIRYKITDCGLNIYFTDKLNQRRFLYFDYEDGISSNSLILQDRFKTIIGYTSDDCREPIYGVDLDCNKITYHPDYKIPCIDSAEVISAGNLKAGVYQFIIGYSDVKSNVLSDYFPSSNTVPVFTKEITFETDYRTNKAISLKISNLEQSEVYGYYNLIVAETINNFTNFYLVGTFPVTQTDVTFTGSEQNLIKLVPDDILTKRAYYKTAGNITDANDILFFSDLNQFSQPNLQKVANKISLYWKTIAVPENLYKDPKNTFNFRGYQRDEVYPFGVIFIKKTGEEIGPFHIPGPSKTKILSETYVDVDDFVYNNDVTSDTSCNNITRNRRWQVYNTGYILGSPHEDSPVCDTDKTWEWGQFSYWESIKKYPNDPEVWGDLCGTPVRFHKFPDSRVTHIHDGLNASKGFFDSNIIYPIGIRVDHESVTTALSLGVDTGVLTKEEADEISSYRIVRGNRVGNKSIIAKGLLFDVWSYNKNNNTYYYPNYAYNDLRPDRLISGTESTYLGGNNSDPIPNTFTPTKRYTFHSPDTHFNNPAIGTEIKIETEEYGTSEGFFNIADEQAKQKFLSTFSRTFAFALGVAAAFSAEKEKHTRVITSKSQRNILPFVAGTTPGATATIPVPVPFAEQGDYFVVNPLGASDYNETTGLPDPLLGAHPFAYTSSHESYKGTKFQLLGPLSGNPAGIFLQQIPFLAIIGLKEMQIAVDLLKSISPLKNFSIQYNSVGRYNNFKHVNNTGNKIREVERSAYLEPIVQLVNEAINAASSQFTNVFINNWNRERSVYIKSDNEKPALPSPTVTDSSRFTMNEIGFDQEDLEKRTYNPISSYYCSIKNFLPDQYGDVTNISYLEVGGCPFILAEDYTESQDGIYGGDTFITRFGIKRKMPFFLQTRFKQGNETDVRYSELGNVGYPNYYFNTEEPLLERIGGNTFGGDIFGILTDILGVANTRLDAKKQKAFYQSGFIHLYNYGIPYFLAESDINTEYRHGENNNEKDFYPHQQDLGYWFQEKNVPITEDNYYFYNTTYSKQNKESVIKPQVTKRSLDCTVNYPTRIINSETSYNQSEFDNWLVFKANNLYDAPSSFGRVIGLDGIENDRVVVRFENSSQIFNSYDVLEVDNSIVQVGSGELFKTKPKEFSSVDLGYAGTQHTDMLKTEFGHIWVDAKRGQVFNLLPDAKGLEELGKSGMKNWFKENLPFQLLKDFSNITLEELDNNFKGIGIALSFDKRFSRFFITKLDYRKINRDVVYNSESKVFEVNGEEVLLSNKNYFCNKSWTISYNFITKSWVSFHSFTPNFYIDDVEYIQSGVNKKEGISEVWSHNITNKSYQVYYGKLYPFVIESITEAKKDEDILNSVEFDTSVIRYHNLYDSVHNRKVTYNKAIIYNDRQCSGLLELIPRDENNLYNALQYPKVVNNKIQILTTNKDNKWRFNQFYDAVNSQTANLPFFKNQCNNADKELYLKAFNYYKPDLSKQLIRGRYTKIRLINDAKSNYKFIHHFINNNQNTSKS